MWRADERRRWRRRGGEWRRGGGVRLRVGPSEVHGLGLFACDALEEGAPLGWVWGETLRAGATPAEAEAYARAQGSDRVMLLHDGPRTRAVVDVRGCVFEWANDAADEASATLHVGERGAVETARAVRAGEELRWWYADPQWRHAV